MNIKVHLRASLTIIIGVIFPLTSMHVLAQSPPERKPERIFPLQGFPQQKQEKEVVEKSPEEILYQKKKEEANKSIVTVISGGISGTYIRFATDLANVLDDKKDSSLRILPIAGKGGGQNVLDILFVRGIDMGITQQDHLTFFKQQDPVLHANINKHVHYITKLYNAEYHVVARKDIKSLKDLDGKTVNMWKPNSATDIAGRTIFKILGINVKRANYDTQTGLQKVKNGEIAATTLLAGAPISGFKNIPASDELHLVPLSYSGELYNKELYEGRLLDVYLPARLKSEDYPGLLQSGQTINTVASGAILAVYNWPRNTARYRKTARFVRKFFSRIEEFKKDPRHPKWREVNLAAKVPGWTRFAAAEEELLKLGLLSKNEHKTRSASQYKHEELFRKFESYTADMRDKEQKQP